VAKKIRKKTRTFESCQDIFFSNLFLQFLRDSQVLHCSDLITFCNEKHSIKVFEIFSYFVNRLENI
jgi:hypothetical protein